MTGLGIWGAALFLYGAFRLWYDGRRRPLSAAEIDGFMARIERSAPGQHSDPAILRAFLEKDDGREFLMLNLVRLHPQPVADPYGGEPAPEAAMLKRYTDAFVPALMRRGGHPALVAVPAGGYVDAWQAPPDPGWTLVGVMRYRSRRDMIALATDARFEHAHAFKVAATALTFSFPTRPRLLLFLSPRVWVGLVLALAAALLHLALTR